MKPGDNFCLPLDWQEHAKQHSGSEQEYWKQYGGIEEAKKLANDLYDHTGNSPYGFEAIAKFRYGHET